MKRYIYKNGDWSWLYEAGDEYVLVYPRKDKIISSTYNPKTDKTRIIIEINK